MDEETQQMLVGSGEGGGQKLKSWQKKVKSTLRREPIYDANAHTHAHGTAIGSSVASVTSNFEDVAQNHKTFGSLTSKSANKKKNIL